MAGQVARLAASVAPPLLSLGRRDGRSAVRVGLVRVSGCAGGRCLGPLALRHPSASLSPCLGPHPWDRGRPAAQPLGDLVVLQQLHEIVHRPGLVPGGPAFGPGGQGSDAAVDYQPVQQRGALPFDEPPLRQANEL